MKGNTALLMMLAVLALTAVSANAQKVVLMIRHSDIQMDDPTKPTEGDPPLNEAGLQRAKLLVKVLKDAGIKAIYTSDSLRTMQTAEPLAQALKIQPVRVSRKERDALIPRLRAEHPNDVVLIVSHVQDVPEFAKALGSSEKVEIGRADFDNLILVVAKSEGPPIVVRLRY